MFLIFLNKNSIEHSIIHFTVYNRLLYITENFYDVTNIHRIGKTRGLNRFNVREKVFLYLFIYIYIYIYITYIVYIHIYILYIYIYIYIYIFRH